MNEKRLLIVEDEKPIADILAYGFRKDVGLSNKLDSELVGRKPVKRSHGQVVGTAIMDGKLLCKIVQ